MIPDRRKGGDDDDDDDDVSIESKNDEEGCAKPVPATTTLLPLPSVDPRGLFGEELELELELELEPELELAMVALPCCPSIGEAMSLITGVLGVRLR